jgi:hypothetical protein
LFIIGGNNQGKNNRNPDLADLDQGDLKHDIDFKCICFDFEK